jgi:hypothetical protein
MLTLSYKNFRNFLRTIPICPKPKAIGLENIPKNEPTLFVYNHVTRRAEPLFLGLAAPASPYIRFFAEITLVSAYQLSRTKRDIVNSMFSQNWQKKMNKNPWRRSRLEKFADFLTRFFIAQISRFQIIPVYLHDPPTREEELKKWRINKNALEECLKCLESHIPVAIAPSGGSTHETVDIPVSQTIVPTLASLLYKRGKVVKIVPSVVKERPEINKKTYKKYVTNRIFFYRFLRWLMNKIKIKSYEQPRLTVEFLPPLTFAKANPSKSEKVLFVAELQKIMYTALSKEN